MKLDWDKIILWILISIVVTLPLQVTELLFPIHILGSQFPVFEFSRILTAVGIVALGIKFLLTKKVVIPRDPLSILLYVFVVINGLSLVIFQSNAGFLELLRYSFYLGFFLLAINAIHKSGDFEKVIKSLLTGGFVISLFSIFQYFSGFYLWNGVLSEWVESIGRVVNRVNATFLDPNTLATFLGILIIFSTAYYSLSVKKLYKILASSVAITSMAALFYSFSRAGLVSFGVSFLSLILFLPKNLKMMSFYIILASTAVLVYISSPGVRSRVENIYDTLEVTTIDALNKDAVSQETAVTDDVNSSEADNKEGQFGEVQIFIDRALSFLPLNYDRLATIKAGILMFLSNPVFGVGLGNFQKIYIGEYSFLIRYEYPGQPNHNPVTSSHSSIVTVLSELGVIGLIWFLAFLGALVKYFLKIIRSDLEYKSLLLAAGSALLLLILHSQYQGGLFENPYFWLLSSFMVIGQRAPHAK